MQHLFSFASGRRWCLAWGLLATAGTVQAQTLASFAPVVTYPTGGSISLRVVTGDFNGDGRLDAVTANIASGDVSVFLNSGSGTFGAATRYAVAPANTQVQGLTLADVNADGRLDIVTANNGTNTVSVLLGQAGGTFGAYSSYPTGTNTEPRNAAVGDVNGDGRLDIVTGNSGTATASVLLGQAGGGFGAPALYATAGRNFDVALGDVNADGRLDIVTPSFSTNSVSVLPGQGGGTFGAFTSYNTGTNAQSVGVRLGDVNTDGRLDLVISNQNSTVSVLLGQAGGTLAPVATYSTGVITSAYAVSIGDVNNDGRPDLVVGNLTSSPIGVLLGQASGFGPITTFTGGNGPQGITLADVNEDGKPDILTANRNDNTLGVLLNTTVFTAPTLTSISPSSGLVGTSVTLTGTNLGSATAVRFFNGVAATFSVVNATTLTATVPTGASTGPVTVTTGGGTSNGVVFTVVAPVQLITPSPLPSGTVGQGYNQTISASGGSGTYAFALASGTLPAGLTLASDGTLAGTPTAGGSFAFTVRATDTSPAPGPYSGTQAYALTVAPPSITLTPATLPNGQVGTAYSQTLAATGGTAPYTFGVTSGALPPGLRISSSGTIAGTPTAAGSFSVTLTAYDASTGRGPYAGSRFYSLTITAAPTAAPTVTAPAAGSTTSGVPTFAGTAPAGSTVALYLAQGSSPAQFLGTTTATGGTFSLTSPTTLSSGPYTVYATAQSSGSTVSGNSNLVSFTVDNTAPAPTVSTTAPSPTSTAPIPFSVTFSEPVTGFVAADLDVTGGTLTAGSFSGSGSGPYSFSVTPTAPGPITVRVPASVAQDAVGNLSTASNTVSVLYNLPNQAPVIADQRFSVPASSPAGTVVGTVVASDPDAGQTLSYSITAGNPAGAFAFVGNQLQVANAAVLTSTGTYALTVQVQDNGTPSLSSSATVTVTVTPVTQVLYRLNAGGPAVNTSLGTFAADQYFSSSRTGANSGPIAGTTDDALYQTERFEGAFGYSLRVPNGTYQVVLHFAELYWTQPGQRIFDVRAENQLVLDNYDILRKVAPFTATTETFTVVVTDGVLNLDLSALQSDGGRDAAKLSALEVLSRSAGPNQAPVVANQSFSVAEGSVAGTLVGTVVASDPDAGQTLSYAVTAGNTDGAFAFVGNQLQVANAAAVRTAASPFTLMVRVTDDGQPAQSTTATVTVTVTPGMQVFYRLNAGGPAVNTTRGQFAADQYFSPSRTGANSGPIAGTTDDALYQTERFEGAFGYSLRVPNGTYQVVLHFAETYWTQAGQRLFDVRAENQLVLDNYDILKKVAPFTATTETFSVVVTDGVLNLDLSALQSDGGRDAAKLSALEVLAPAATQTRSTLASQAVLATARTGKLAARLEAMPNPFTDQIGVSFQLPQAEAYSLTVYDLAGRVLTQQNGQPVSAGERQQVALALGRYPVGVYLVRLTTASGTQQVRVVKH